MNLKEKLCEPFGGLKTETVNELVEIADEFASGFAEWLKLPSQRNEFFNDLKTTKELLEIYKNEKGL